MPVLAHRFPAELAGFTILEELRDRFADRRRSIFTTPISPEAVQALISSVAASHDVWSNALRIFSPASVP
jgi:hypothetical protein